MTIMFEHTLHIIPPAHVCVCPPHWSHYMFIILAPWNTFLIIPHTLPCTLTHMSDLVVIFCPLYRSTISGDR